VTELMTAIDLSVVGQVRGPQEVWWNSSQCLLYAVGVGCGVDDLEFSTENSLGMEQRVLPTFATVAGEGRAFAVPPELERDAGVAAEKPLDLGFGPVDPRAIRHAGQRIELARPLPTAARVNVWGSISAIWDKGSAALVEMESHARDAETDELLYTSRVSLYIAGAGGFGGDRGPTTRQEAPDRDPDEQVTYHVGELQPYVYRLAHGRHALHSDPQFAAKSGLERPIIAGLCTYGYTGRALLDRLCGRDPGRFVSMEGRFSAPVYPGDDLTVKIWVEGEEAHFVTETQCGEVAISHGRCAFGSA
jgi:acyl dehydratase